MRKLNFILLMIIAILSSSSLIIAQQDEVPPPRQWQVFVADAPEGGGDRLTFVDMLSGEIQTSTISGGERYTTLADAVLYYDMRQARLMTVRPNTLPQPLTSTPNPPNIRRIDWAVSDDLTHLAWTLTTGDGGNLSTVTYVQQFNGEEAQIVFEDGPRNDGLRAMPVAFSPDNSQLYMDFQPDGVADLTIFPQYARLFSVNIATGEIADLPGEPGCFCGAGFGAGWFLRLGLTPDGQDFDLYAVLLPDEAITTIPAFRLRNFTQAGAIHISPDGKKAVYARVQFSGFGTEEASAQTVLILADLSTMTQEALGQPIEEVVYPTGWTEDNTAVLISSKERSGTWKIHIQDGTLHRIATETYIGVITAPYTEDNQ